MDSASTSPLNNLEYKITTLHQIYILVGLLMKESCQPSPMFFFWVSVGVYLSLEIFC